MTNQATQDFLESTEVTGALSPEQAAELIARAMGDTVATSTDSGALPGSTTSAGDNEGGEKEGDKGEGAKPAADAAPDGDKAPVLLAKDGVHTIDYQKLVDARQGEQHWRAQAEALQAQNQAAEQELSALRAAAQARADNGQAPTQQDNMVAAVDAAKKAGVDISIFGDMSEEAMAKGIDALVDLRVAAAVDAKVAEALKPFKERHEQAVKSQEEQAAEDHRNAVLKAHPDAVSIWQSTELQKWIGDKPAYEQAAIRDVLESGETADLIAVFTRYKKEEGITPAPAPAAPDPKAAAKAAIASAAPAIPNSLSGIPGGRAGGTTVHDSLAAMDGVNLANAMANMSPAQIEAFLSRQM